MVITARCPSRPQRVPDLTGQRFGIVVVEARSPSVNGKARWRCRCDTCGDLHVYEGSQLRFWPPKRCKGNP